MPSPTTARWLAEAAYASPAPGTVPVTPSSAAQEPDSWLVHRTELSRWQREPTHGPVDWLLARPGMIAAPSSTSAIRARLLQAAVPRLTLTCRHALLSGSSAQLSQAPPLSHQRSPSLRPCERQMVQSQSGRDH